MVDWWWLLVAAAGAFAVGARLAGRFVANDVSGRFILALRIHAAPSVSHRVCAEVIKLRDWARLDEAKREVERRDLAQRVGSRAPNGDLDAQREAIIEAERLGQGAGR